MRFVPPKSTDQLAIQAIHRIRRRLVADRGRLVNQIRCLLSEHGIVIARDISQLRRSLAVIVENDDDGLCDMVRSLMRELRAQMAELDDCVANYDRRIREIFRTSEQCQRLGQLEGIGPVTATALIAAGGNRTASRTAVSSRPGSARCRNNDPVEAEPASSGSANVAIAICAH